MEKYIEMKLVDFVNYFNFTKEDIEIEVDFAYEAEYQAQEDECAYNIFYSFYDEIKNYYNTLDVYNKINELVKEYLTKTK